MPAAKKKPTKTKATTSGFKSKPKWKIGFLILVGILFVTSIEYGIYSKLRADNLTARATAYTYIGQDGNTAAYACKTYIPVYGGVYRITALYVKLSSAYPSRYRIASYRGVYSLNGGVTSSLYWNNVAGTQTINLSALHDDSVRIYIEGQNIYRQSTSFESRNLRPANIGFC